MTRLLAAFCCVTLSGVISLHSAQASVVVGGTRIIYDAGKQETSIPVKNTDKKAPFLVQSWVESYPQANEEKPPFIITPPLFRLDGGKENILRIVRTGGNLPDDRESVFWANIKAIPGSESTDTNRLLISVKTKIKLFYRPAALKEGAALAYKQLTFSKQGDHLAINNPTPYFLSFNSLTVGGFALKHPGMIAPKSSMTLPLDNPKSSSVTWQMINDFGGITAAETRSF